MTIPKYEDLMLPLLQRASLAGKELSVPELLPELAREFALSDDEIEQRLTSGRQTLLANRCHWAQIYMRRAGLLESVRRGHFKITDRGQKLLAEKPARIDRITLSRYTEFADWIRISRASGDENSATASSAIPPTDVLLTPDEQIQAAFEVLNASLKGEILSRIRTISPQQFEQIVVDLLIAMGFGGGDPEMGARIGRSGDGGIDGVIQEDALGLDAIYVQAKRYKEGSSIGSPHLHSFIGSLVGQRATKGVFVTTSSFTKEAREYVKSVHHRVVLIDGDELAGMLVRHGVGVREDRIIAIKKLDEDYFSNEI